MLSNQPWSARHFSNRSCKSLLLPFVERPRSASSFFNSATYENNYNQNMPRMNQYSSHTCNWLVQVRRDDSVFTINASYFVNEYIVHESKSTERKLRTSSFSTLKHWCHSCKLLISWIELSILIISSVSCDAIYLRSLINQSTFSFLRFITASPSAILPFWASVRTCRWPKCIIITDKLAFYILPLKMAEKPLKSP